MTTSGRINYEAYRDCMHYTAYRVDPMPPWPMIEQPMKEAWEEAAEAVISHYIEVSVRKADDVEDSLTRVKPSVPIQ
jgi:hypothetical protein